jgi:hypothetical protein
MRPLVLKDIVFTAMTGRIPNTVREDGALKLLLGAATLAASPSRTI